MPPTPSKQYPFHPDREPVATLNIDARTSEFTVVVTINDPLDDRRVNTRGCTCTYASDDPAARQVQEYEAAIKVMGAVIANLLTQGAP